MEPTIDEMLDYLDAEVPEDRSARAAYNSGLITDEDVRSIYANWRTFGDD